jgi:hypothetical protein
MKRGRPTKDTPYLNAPCFAEANDGPLAGGCGPGRDPSAQQIHARCLAIQTTWSGGEAAFRMVPHLDGILKDESQTHWQPPSATLEA